MKELMQDIPDYADLMTLEKWQFAAKEGYFIPYDGDGHWATSEKMDWNSDVWESKPPEWATHVAWFNR